MVNRIWLPILLVAIGLSGCGQDAPETAAPTATTYIPVWLPTAVANAPVPTAVPKATLVPIPKPTPMAIHEVEDACDLRQLYVSLPPDGRLRGMKFSLEVWPDERWVELQATERNDTDEPIHYRTGDFFFVIVDASRCEVVWAGPSYDVPEPRYDATLQPDQVYRRSTWWGRVVDNGRTVPPGSYLAYVIYRFAQPRAEPPVPDTVYISSPKTIEVKAVQRADSPSTTKATSNLRMIDLGYGEPVAREGRRLLFRHSESYEVKDGRTTPIYTFYEVDLDTEERREIPEPEHLGMV